MNKYTLLGLTVLMSLYTSSSAISQNWEIASANQEWVKNEPGIVRKYEQKVTVRNDGKVTVRKTEVNVILRRDANYLAELKVNYTKEVKIISISGIVSDAEGNVIAKSKKSDIKDYSDFSSFSIFEDNRVQVLDLKQFKFPYTVHFEYELELSNMYFIPNWFPQRYNRIPVELARATYQYPESSPIRFYSKNIDCQKEAQADGTGYVSKTWEMRDLEKIEIEPHIASELDAIPHLRAAATSFVYGGIPGDLSTWEGMGRWFYQLNNGRDNLSEATKRKVREIAAKASSDEEKVRLLYEYLQNKTRYVSIQLGIGGLQPFDAQVVDDYSYGDCKALSNYMAALLKTVGIKSHYTLIYGGRNPEELFTDFPDDYFNHVVLNVPLSGDTVWLECTNQTAPFGYLGSFTSDRYALLVSEVGGRLVRTPKYGIGDNVQHHAANFTLHDDDLVKGSVSVTRTGLQVENYGMLHQMEASNEDKKKWIFENLGLPTFEITNFSFQANGSRVPSITLQCDIESKSMVSKTGNRLFITPNLMNATKFNAGNTKKERQYPFKKNSAFLDTDSITFSIPNGYSLELKPEDVAFDTEFGKYTASFHHNDGAVVYVRSLQMNSSVYGPEKYMEYAEFMKKIEKADKSKFVFVKRT